MVKEFVRLKKNTKILLLSCSGTRARQAQIYHFKRSKEVPVGVKPKNLAFAFLFVTTSYFLLTTPCLYAANWASVSSGVSHTLAKKTDGTLWAWGNNGNGQLGLGDTTQRTTPIKVGADTNWSSVSSASSYTLAKKTDGTLWAWGYNDYGQLGLGTTTQMNAPAQIGTLTNWASVSCGWSHTLAIKADGTLWAWGNNGNGQLGLGTTTQMNAPTQIGTLTNWASVSCGAYQTLAKKTDGTLWAWGHNSVGQLGLGTTTQINTPTQVGSATEWASVSNGSSYTLAKKTDGTLWAWGSNSGGYLGLGTTTQVNTPTQVGSATEWVSVSCGWSHTLAIKTDGTLWAWGNNYKGELGLGDTLQRTTPIKVGTDANWSSVSCGANQTLAIKADGTLWAWGANDNGPLGLGDTTQRTTPMRVGNIVPTLSWTGETNYTSDGLNPEAGASTTFIYRVKYTDADGDAPKSGYPRVHIKKGGVEISGSPVTMSYVSGNYNTGAIYTYSKTALSVGTDYTYYFEAQDTPNGATATGSPTSSVDAPDISNTSPNLYWTGEDNYGNSGLFPDTGNPSTTFVYRVKYTDADGDAPASGYPKVHIKKGSSEISGSPFTMNMANSNSPAIGAIYTFSSGGQAHPYAAGTDYTYYFEAQDSNGATANRQPLTDIDAPDVIDTSSTTTPFVNTTDNAVIITPPSGQVKVEIPAYAFASNFTVTVAQLTSFPVTAQTNIKVVNVGVDITASGLGASVQPQKDITITIGYRDSDISGKDEAKLSIAYYDNTQNQNRWVPIASMPDPSNKRIIGTTRHLSKFAIIELTPAVDLKNAYCYPSPAKLSKGDVIKFSNFSPNATIKILSPAGHTLKTLYADSNGKIPSWNGETDNSGKIGSGTYIIHASDKKGSRKIFKIMVIK